MKKKKQVVALRGPAEHDVRNLIIAAANDYFRDYGYEKTTVTELAKEIGFSKAYIYKFFESKQALGEAICDQCLHGILEAIRLAITDQRTTSGALRVFIETVVAQGTKLFFSKKGLYDIATNAAMHRWDCYVKYESDLVGIIREIVTRGRRKGEFEESSSIEGTCRTITRVLQPFYNPLLLQYTLNDLPQATTDVTALVLKSLKNSKLS